MKKRIIVSGVAIAATILITTGCENGKPFTITCEGKNTDLEGIEITNKTVYNFGSDQNVTNYEVTSISVYENNDKYEENKKVILEEAKREIDGVEYDVKTNDITRTIDLNYKVKLTADSLKELEDENYYKAATVLKRAEEEYKNKCTIEGIKRSELK